MYKKYIQGKKAVFFDLDGTIVKETEGLKTKAIQKTLNDAQVGFISAEEYSFDGYSFETTWKVILNLNTIPEKKTATEWADITNKNYMDLIKESSLEPVGGFWDLIYELKNEKGFKLALVTNSTRDVTEIVMNKLEITNTFDLVICGDEVRKKKPNPEMYKKAARQLKVKRKDVLVFEDSPAGLEAATKAGMDTIVIWDELTPKRNFKGKILDFMSDFTPLPGNLDETKIEYIQRRLKEMQLER